MIEIPPEISSENFMRPVVNAWLQKLEAAKKDRARWDESVKEIMMFYGRSAAAMWDSNYAKKFWRGNIQPRFRVSINLAYEYVAVMLPNLLWENPHRTVSPKALPSVDFNLFGADEQMMQQMQMEQAILQSNAAAAASLQQDWLNYTVREQPAGLLWHSTMATMDALLKGRGCLWTRPHMFPGSDRLVTGCFREPPERMYIDPDATSLNDAKWICLVHYDQSYDVERRFKLKKDSLRNRGTMESSWTAAEHLVSGRNPRTSSNEELNDVIVWYEFYSKCGCGTRRVKMNGPIKEHMENLVGDYAYLAISPSVPWLLNCSDEFMKTASSEEIRAALQWPIPLFWQDDRWPVEVCDFYPNNNEDEAGCAYPIPPLEPALGEIKLLNILLPWLINRTWSSSRDFWAVAGPYLEHYEEYLNKGDDQTVIPTPAMVDDVRKAISIIQQPETRRDMWELIGLVESLFRKRTGLTLTAYGMNEDGTQNRSAEETIAKNRAVGIRPEYMQKHIVDWQSRAAASEAMVARRFVRGKDVQDRIGPTLAMAWDAIIASDDAETICRQLDYTVEAASIRRPNRERDITNFQQAMQLFAAFDYQYGEATGDFMPYNALKQKWGEYHDADVSQMFLSPPQPDPEAQQMEKKQMELEQQKMQAELQGKQMDIEGKQIDAQGKMMDAQVKQQLAGIEIQKKATELELDAASKQQQISFDAQKAMLDMQLKSGATLQEILMQRARFLQGAQQESAMGAIKAINAVSSGGKNAP